MSTYFPGMTADVSKLHSPQRQSAASETIEIRAAVHHVSLQFWKFKIYSFPWRVGHHFWILVKTCGEKECIVDSIHGLATKVKKGPDNESIYIPTFLDTYDSKLQIYCIKLCEQLQTVDDTLSLHWTRPHKTSTVYIGEDAQQRWDIAKGIIMRLNKENVKYSFCGFGKSFGFYQCKNSNSAYASVGILLGLSPQPVHGYMAPGLRTTMLPKEDLETLRDESQKTFSDPQGLQSNSC